MNYSLNTFLSVYENTNRGNSYRFLTNICNDFGITIPKLGCNVGKELYDILSQQGDHISFLQNGEILIIHNNNIINKETVFGAGSVIAGNVTINHSTKPSVIGSGVYVKDCRIIDSTIGQGVIIEGGNYTNISNSTIGKNTVLFGGAKFRGSIIGPDNEIGYGEFVRTTTGKLMKALHSCYLGDTEVGDDVNIANQFGIVNSGPGGTKSKTIIGNNVFTGGGARIVPGKNGVKVGNGAIIGAGATVLCDIPENHTYINKNKIYPNTKNSRNGEFSFYYYFFTFHCSR